jgi:uncharacterized protein with HEPN domain
MSMHPDASKLLWDAQLAADRATRFCAGKTFVVYEADEILRSAVERQLEIVGKALNQLSRVDATTASLLPDLPRIVAFRNMLIHGYASVDNHIVWGVLETNLPPLLTTLNRLLAQHAKQ